MVLDEFYNQVIGQRDRFFLEARIDILELLPNEYLKLRVRISEEFFISIRFNVRNNRQDLALINEGRRIFGYDNLKSWHCHPLTDPTKHVPCRKPSIVKVFREMSEIVKQLEK